MTAAIVLDRVRADEAFRKEFGAIKSEGELGAFLQRNGYSVTAKQLSDEVIARHGDEMTPEQLHQVSGGFICAVAITISAIAAATAANYVIRNYA